MSKRQLTVSIKHYALKEAFAIAHGTSETASVIEVQIDEASVSGLGESTPYPRYGESLDSVREEILSIQDRIESGCSREELQSLLAAGAARNAIDNALWDLEAQLEESPIWKLAGLKRPHPVSTAFTLSIRPPKEMAESGKKVSYPILKLKCAGDGHDEDRLKAVREACPDKTIIIDANESWRAETAGPLFALCKDLGISMIEQPFPVGQDDWLLDYDQAIPVCADESCHTIDDLDKLEGRYSMVNIKLDKTGGFTHALALKEAALDRGFSIMIGCMLGTALAVRSAFYLAQDAKIVDIDAPLLLAEQHPFIGFTCTDLGEILV